MTEHPHDSDQDSSAYAMEFCRDPEVAKLDILAIAETVRDAGNLHVLKATPNTCFWGFFDQSLPPVLTINSGDIVYVEALTHQAGGAPDLMMDQGVRDVYEQVSDRGPGLHIMTGPIAVKDAEPGDTLVVRILKTTPRLPYGANIAAHWGYLYNSFRKERITVYKLDTASGLAQPAFAYDFKERPLYNQPGLIVPPEATHREPIKTHVAIPLRPHFGIMGVAPPQKGRVNSVPPGPFGGNIDNWRMGAGATVYYPVFTPGANFFVGDPHMGQGDGEISGTAIEASMNAWLQISLLKDFPIGSPLLETQSHWITHGFHDDLNQAVLQCADQMLDFLQTKRKMSADEAYALMSVAVDFGITQVVNQRRGCHAALPKQLFLPTPDLPEV
ncbi:acetamidase/formamidase family protein [Trichocoleus sp. FACHB-262]|uniref:acetamidase/formamidase family protein n=1 Tax=Trichocoleus sp. FACHB-262 TaxID=2692869 RepID=UPI0018EFB175|nr:acetamidase/formamidase family protein [Trichocoleus sp. FACHB-262]